jgi:hypothetical protein
MHPGCQSGVPAGVSRNGSKRRRLSRYENRELGDLLKVQGIEYAQQRAAKGLFPYRDRRPEREKESGARSIGGTLVAPEGLIVFSSLTRVMKSTSVNPQNCI